MRNSNLALDENTTHPSFLELLEMDDSDIYETTSGTTKRSNHNSSNTVSNKNRKSKNKTANKTAQKKYQRLKHFS